MMEAASTSETTVNLYQTTQRNNPEDSHLHQDIYVFTAYRSKHDLFIYETSRS
jgi:hypothetical protein